MKNLLVNLDNLPSAADTEVIRLAIRSTTTQFRPSATSLSQEQRRGMRKMGPRRLAYAQAALRHVTQNEDVLPRSENSIDFVNTNEQYERLIILRDVTSSLLELLDDTVMSIGIDLMRYTKMTHDSFKAANELDPAFDDILAELDDFNKRATQDEAAAATAKDAAAAAKDAAAAAKTAAKNTKTAVDTTTTTPTEPA
jgi:hypothetical protein